MGEIDWMKYGLTPDKCIEILKDAGCDDNVIEHCQVVSDLAVKIAKRIKGADVELVQLGGLLHDLGRAKTHGIGHAVEGAKLASRLGLPEEIIGIIRNHIGAGLTTKEAELLGLPVENYIPERIEQKIVAHADNLIDYFQPVPVSDILEKLSKHGQMGAVERIKKLHRELSEQAGIDIDEIVKEW